MTALVLVTEAFGGRGGIAQFNRDLLGAIAQTEIGARTIVLPRRVQDKRYVVSPKVNFRTGGSGSKLRFISHVLHAGWRDEFDLVICCHLHLLPAAVWAATRRKVPLVLVLFGIEAWSPRQSFILRRALRSVDHVVAISDVTRQRFLSWAPIDPAMCSVIPCAVDEARFGIGSPRPDLVARHDLADRRVILTVARLAGAERYKGIDEVLAVLPALSASMPNILYLIVGEGDDRHRLERLTARLGIRDRVVFVGYVGEEDKADYYRLADLLVMPGRGEGFGIVYLEALACGTPVIGSTLDASRETLLEGALGQLVDPREPKQLQEAILRQLTTKAPRQIPAALAHFSVANFTRRWKQLLEHVCSRGQPSTEPLRAQRSA